MSDTLLLVEEYTPLSTVIYTGKNKQYDEKLKEMGGKKGTSFAKFENNYFDVGFVFSKKTYEKNRDEFIDFIDKVNNGTYEDTSEAAKAVAPVKKTLIRINKEKLMEPTKPAMTAEDIAKKLAANRIVKTTVSTASGVSTSTPRPLIEEQLESTTTELNYPNKFVGSDKNEYQIMVHTVLVPKVGQKCTIDNVEFEVESVDMRGLLILQSNVDNIRETSKGSLIGGKWAVVQHNNDIDFIIF